MQTLTKQQIRSQVIKLTKLSDKKPDYYFIQGYLLGLGVNPEMVMPNHWQVDLFGDFKFGSQDDMQLLNALMELYNLQMDSIMQQQIKLPPQCALSINNYQQALAQDAPLTNWCAGFAKALSLINTKTLKQAQQKELKDLRFVVNQLAGNDPQAQELLAENCGFIHILLQHKKYLTTRIHNTIYAMRFEGNLTPDADVDHLYQNESQSELVHVSDEQLEEFDELVDIFLSCDSTEIREGISDVIKAAEELLGDHFVEDNTGYFWGLHETRPYMMLRARRAEFAFKEKRYQACADELEALMVLNPNDNQGNRYLLMNCYVLLKQWDKLNELLSRDDEESLFTMASKVLNLYALQGDSAKSKTAKKELKQYNKFVERFLTGQVKLPKELPEYYGLGDKNEAVTYVCNGGKLAWQSVEGALFWLRRK
ncbi:UPF0149 family protein [Catenovulum adriaticum]|uniref:YecA family protein n=1 Tax=Catenovulum adriaticum TaxID=2984846 RepID=A0ABY7APL7_9ALTE|nr:UPF0149 family protein [Catenovulum sp. TS8]WAJ70196.1 YecA family protein [Catenovulum sp. TS8]